MARSTSATRKRPLPRRTPAEAATAEAVEASQVEETTAPTTQDPDGNEAVVEIDGTPTEPNSDGTDGGTIVQEQAGGDALPHGDGAPLADDTATAPGIPPLDESDTTTPPVDAQPNDNLTDEDILTSKFRTYWQNRLEESGAVPPEGRLLFPGEPLTFSGNRIAGDMVILTEDIFRVVFPFRSITPTFTLEARKGKRIHRAKVVTKAEYLRSTNQMVR